MDDDERAQIMINTKNIDSLNCAKGIACIFVILIHCTFPGIVGEMLQAIARFAVPLFFTVTGYFLLDSHGKVTRARILYIIGLKLISKKWKPVYATLALLTLTLLSEVLPTFGVQRSFTSFHIGIHNFFGL